MTEMSLHGEWLALMEVSGPFLAEPILKDVFPQGLEEIDPERRKLLRQAYGEWRDAIELDEIGLAPLHDAWISLVLRQGLEFDEDGSNEILKHRNELSGGLTHKFTEHGVELRPDYAVVDDRQGDNTLMLISICEPHTDLNESLRSDGWAASPAERMVELCRANQTRLGLVTNGEHWMLVDALSVRRLLSRVGMHGCGFLNLRHFSPLSAFLECVDFSWAATSSCQRYWITHLNYKMR